jgi:nitrogen fixation-related uncharacterized protein
MDTIRNIAFGVLAFVLALPTLSYAQEGFQNPLKSNLSTVDGFIQGLLQAATYILFPVAILFVVWSGFKFVLAQGSESEITSAKKNFFYTLIGVALILGAYALAALVRGTVNQITGQ